MGLLENGIVPATPYSMVGPIASTPVYLLGYVYASPPVASAAVIILIESWVRRGDPFVSGYERNRGAETVLPYSGLPGFRYPFFFGVLSILLSFGKGRAAARALEGWRL